MKHSEETILLVARAIACHSAPDKAQLWEANAVLNALHAAGYLATPEANEERARSERARQFMQREAGYHVD
jgi:hypothetical protein